MNSSNLKGGWVRIYTPIPTHASTGSCARTYTKQQQSRDSSTFMPYPVNLPLHHTETTKSWFIYVHALNCRPTVASNQNYSIVLYILGAISRNTLPLSFARLMVHHSSHDSACCTWLINTLENSTGLFVSGQSAHASLCFLYFHFVR